MDTERSHELKRLSEQLLVRDVDAHAEAIKKLSQQGDERVVPHLVEIVMIDSIANQWEAFGFPEVMRDRSPPRYLELPEAEWPGVVDALCELAEPNFDSDHAWVEWETWYSQQDIEPLEGFDEWKLRLYRSYLPPVGGLLEATPRTFDLQDIRWGNCDRSFLAALNEPDFVPAAEVDAGTDTRDDRRYLTDDDLVFGFEIEGTAYAVPRWILFPHELLNATIDGHSVSLTYCTLCNAPILYERTVGDRTLTFGSSGMLLEGNKVMFDEETESLWSQHRGVPIAGEYLSREERLDIRSITQTNWGEWKRENPDSRTLDIETGYDYDYGYYTDEIGIFRHYWENESVVQPGVEAAESELPEKERVYGVTTEPDGTRIYPTEAVRREGIIVDDDSSDPRVVLEDPTGDVAVYRAPPLPVERNGNALVDDDQREWTIAREELASRGETLDRVPGRHGLWFAFRSQYEDLTVIAGSK
ncbi:DUF3179 domain-containing (seleno)protein [Halostagnicola bangensis]